MKHRMTRGGREVAVLLWSCVALFGARVVGQFEALVASPPWLPDMDAWYSGLLPYYLLLPVQIALLMIMAVVAWNRRVRTGRFALSRPGVARVLRILATVYFLAMVVRLLVDVGEKITTSPWLHDAPLKAVASAITTENKAAAPAAPATEKVVTDKTPKAEG